MTTLQLGSKGQEVLNIQCALIAAGVYSGDIDGSFGPHMQAAVTEFQTQKSLPANGIVDAATAAALGIADTPPVPCRVAGITAQLIAPMFPGTPVENIEANLPYLLNALADTGLCDKPMVLMTLATIRAETASFLPISEGQSSFNTSPGGQAFDRYDHMTQLGNQGPPDGANFRGRGFIQLTGRANYQIHGQSIGKELTSTPVLAHEQETAARLLASFLKAHESAIRAALAANNLGEARKLVNGGSNGLVQFEAAYSTGLNLIPDDISANAANT
jgi:peptidoglycan L-alanyl-D-glutamate endopeptidase CwlK